MKVSYRRDDGSYSTAYLDDAIEPNIWVGANKHTDEPVTVRWGVHGWEEIR